jgi:hypothetical protein
VSWIKTIIAVRKRQDAAAAGSRGKSRAPKIFLEAYPEAAFEVVNRDNSPEFIGIGLTFTPA